MPEPTRPPMVDDETRGHLNWNRESIEAIIRGMRLRGVSDGSAEMLEALLYDAESYQRCAQRKQLALEQRDEARSRIAIARLVAEHRSIGNTDPALREALVMVLAALEGEADPARLGVDGPLGHAIRTRRAGQAADAELVAADRADVPALAAEVADLRDVLHRVRAVLADWSNPRRLMSASHPMAELLDRLREAMSEPARTEGEDR